MMSQGQNIALKYNHDTGAQITMSSVVFGPFVSYGYEDLAALSDNWLSDGAGGGDFDSSGTVDFEDFARLANAWLE